MLLEYKIIEAELKKAKAVELKLRNEIIRSYRYDKVEGVQNREFNDGDFEAELKIGLKISRSLDREMIDDDFSTYTEEEQAVIDFKPALKTKEYKALMATGLYNRLIQAVTEKPAQASLSVEVLD